MYALQGSPHSQLRLIPAHHGASVFQVCKVETWLSVYTFAKFYKVDLSADASLGCKVAQASL